MKALSKEESFRILDLPGNSNQRDILKAFNVKRESEYLSILNAPHEESYHRHKRNLELLEKAIQVLSPDFVPEEKEIPQYETLKQKKNKSIWEAKMKISEKFKKVFSNDNSQKAKSEANENSPRKIISSRKPIKPKWQHLLTVAVIILALISAYTTAEGFGLIWRLNTLIENFVAWSFAIALSALLVYCSVNIPVYYRRGQAKGLTITFVLIALLSFFFNFNSIYPRVVKKQVDDYHQEFKKTNDLLIRMKDKTLKHLTEYTGVEDLMRNSDSLQVLIDREIAGRNKSGKPGIGPEAKRLLGEQAKIEAMIAAKFGRYEVRIQLESQKADSLYHLSKRTENVEELNILLSEMKSNINIIGMLTQNVDSAYTFEPIPTDVTLGKVNTGIEVLAKLLKGQLEANEVSGSFLSLFISFLLDFPVFFILMFLHRRSEEDGLSIKDLFAEIQPPGSNNGSGKKDIHSYKESEDDYSETKP